MASDAAPTVNGFYNGQHGSPAELPGPSNAVSHTASASQSTTTSTTASPKADPQEIGWYFVEQYYTTLSKTPERIHLFYSKKSQLVTGEEAEKVVPAVGVKAIGEKIKELDIHDCKVRVLNVDSQASFHNIVVQVIGEMSNKSEPHHKFVQTFVLAEQPNGYFVLNDIFRYLNDDVNEIVEDEPDQGEAATASKAHTPPAPALVEAERPQEVVGDTAAAELVDAKLEEVAESQVEERSPRVNGLSDEQRIEEPATVPESAQSTQEAMHDANKGSEGETPSAPVETESPHEPDPTPVVIQTPPKAMDSAPGTEAPVPRKTWASMVGTKASVVPAVPASPAALPPQPRSQNPPRPASAAGQADTPEPAGSPGLQGSHGWQTADHGKKQSRPQPKSATEQNVLAYIKNVTEKITASELRAQLERYGELKYFDVSRQRNCAFVEFAEPSGYNAAVAANPHSFGTEQIYVEERRPRPNAFGGSNAAAARGAYNASRGRGGMPGGTGGRGGGFLKEAGRGNFQQRGGKSGVATPKGRGQPQSA